MSAAVRIAAGIATGLVPQRRVIAGTMKPAIRMPSGCIAAL
jgi:hypothetical protein